MDEQEFDQTPQILFEGVTSIPKRGIPGTLIPLTNDTRAVLAGEDSNNVLLVATRFGQGRSLVFAHNGYTSLFLEPPKTSEEQKFVDNCKRWLSRGQSNETESIDGVKSMNDVSGGKILVWDGHRDKSAEFMNDLCAFLQGGGALVCATTAWGWLQGHSGKHLSDFGFARFCDYLGVKVTDNYNNCADPVRFQPKHIAFKNVHQVAERLVQDPTRSDYLAIVGSAIRELEDTLPGVPRETLENIVWNTGKDAVPNASCPIKDKKCREQSNGVCGILCALPGMKAPGVSLFPGDFEHPPHIVTNEVYTVTSSASEWFCTGYYVAAGVPIQVEVLQQDGAQGWSMRIGCHSDDLGNCSELRRWPCISICKPLPNTNLGTSIHMNSAFGGLLFLQSPSKQSQITVKLHHVVPTPTYDLLDAQREEAWEYKRQHAQGLWADIAGQYIVFNVPSKSVRHLEASHLDRALQFWDKVVLAHHDLRGTKPEHRERVVCDEQPSAGYMHSGYPIVTHLDVSDPKNEGYLFNYETLEKKGAWGLFHEIGHNMQRDQWTFEGTGEVTVNIFTLHAMQVLCNLPGFDEQGRVAHTWLKDQIASTKDYIKKGSHFDKWKEQPGVALCIYAQLAREFGWEGYKEVMRAYEANMPRLGSNQEKMDYWIETFSNHVGKNLVPLFKFWGFPVSDVTVHKLSLLEIPQIFDEFIQVAPERYAVPA